MRIWTDYEFENAFCPICGPDIGQELQHDFDPFQVVSCRECELTFLSPRFKENDIMQFYQGQDYYAPSHARQGYDDSS